MLDSDNLAFDEDENGYVQFDSKGVKVDKWEVEKQEGDYEDVDDVDEFFKKPDKKTKSRKDIYQDWKY
jgi:hypothetical protein